MTRVNHLSKTHIRPKRGGGNTVKFGKEKFTTVIKINHFERSASLWL